MFFKGSRYEKVNNGQFTTANGRVITYKRIRSGGTAGYDCPSVLQGSAAFLENC
jgi:hypothetical protein